MVSPKELDTWLKGALAALEAEHAASLASLHKLTLAHDELHMVRRPT